MKLSVLFTALVLWSGSAAMPLSAQTQLVSKSYFPADQEFRELRGVTSEKVVTDSSGMSALPEAGLFADAGVRRYEARSYALAGAGTRMSIEIATTKDPQGAYSLLTLLGGGEVEKGPPGDFRAGGRGAYMFTNADCWIRIRTDAPENLVRRVAASIGNRVGRHVSEQPSLLTHLPETGCDRASVRYFLGPQSLAAYGVPVAGKKLEFRDLEGIVQTGYSVGDQRGELTLLSFPTPQLAEDYFNTDAFTATLTGKDGAAVFTRRAGPIISILEGNFGAAAADKILSSIKYSYTVKWIYDEQNERPRTVWGVPVGILGTVVRSLLFTALLCLLSIVVGAGIAFARIGFRRWRRHGRESDDFIRLNMK